MIKSKFSKIVLLTFVILISANTAIFAQRKTTQSKPAVKDTILVEIKDANITTQDLRDKINSLPSMYRHRYKSVDGQKQILDMMITEQVFYKKALELGYDQNEDVKKAIHDGIKPIANQIYFEELVKKEVKFNPKDAEDHYNKNRASYSIAPKVTIQHLQIDEEDLTKVKSELNNNADFTEIIKTYSKNSHSAGQNGMIQNIRLNGFITGIGQDSQLDKHISDASIDQHLVHGPFITSTGIHFFKKLNYEPTIIRPFSEVKDEIETRLKAQKENQFYTEHIDKLQAKYKVKFHNELLNQYNVLSILPEQRDVVIAEGNHPEIKLTLGDIGQILRNAAANERMDINNQSIRDNVIKREIESKVLYAAAQDTKIPEKFKNRTEIQQVYLGNVLNSWYRGEIMGKTEVTRDEILEYYAENTDKYTIPGSKNIRQFVAKDEKAAKKHHKAIARMLNRNQEDRIITLVRKESLNSDADGMLSNIYNNKIIPGLGIDETYNNKVFETKTGQLSDIFRNKDNQVVFFYVVEEIEEKVRPLAEVENSLQSIIQRRKANELFEQTKEILLVEYNVVKHLDRIVSAITPEELFTLAEQAQKKFSFGEAIFYFDQIISDYENSDHAYKAMFMKAFVTAEDLKDKAKAIDVFEELLSKYPNGDLNESAEFMLEALKSDTPIEMLISE